MEGLGRGNFYIYIFIQGSQKIIAQSLFHSKVLGSIPNILLFSRFFFTFYSFALQDYNCVKDAKVEEKCLEFMILLELFECIIVEEVTRTFEVSFCAISSYGVSRLCHFCHSFVRIVTSCEIIFIVSSNLRRQSTVKLESNCHSDAVLLNYVECWQCRSAINSSCLIIVICLSERKTWKQRSVVKIIW